MRKFTKILAVGAVVGFAMAGASAAYAEDIDIHGDVHLRSSSGSRADIVNISRGDKSVATVGVASIQLINPRRRADIEIHTLADVTSNVRYDGDITNVARGVQSLATVGVGSIQLIQPISTGF